MEIDDRHGIFDQISDGLMRKDMDQLLNHKEVFAATNDIDGWLQRFEDATGLRAIAEDVTPTQPAQLMRSYRITI